MLCCQPKCPGGLAWLKRLLGNQIWPKSKRSRVQIPPGAPTSLKIVEKLYGFTKYCFKYWDTE
jgi:hypothetical protein